MSELLATKSVLIVAKKLDDIGQVRSIVAGLSPKEVSVASSANMAANILRLYPYDIVIAEHDLGEGEKTGLQVIEEASREGLRRCVDSYLLVVDKDMKPLPRDSVLCGPDSFLARPLDHGKVIHRLENIIKLKHAVLPVESLIDKGDIGKALKFIPLLAQRHPSLELYLNRLKGRILLTEGLYSQAVEHFSAIAADRNIDWAFLGAGIANFQQGHMHKASDALSNVLNRNDKSLEAYEWMSKIHRVTGNQAEAQNLLTAGCIKLPTTPTLHTGLGNVASENQNWDVAAEAFRSAVNYAKHSFHQTQDNYFGLARSLQTKLTTQADKQSTLALEEAVRVLENVVEEYYDDDHTRFRSRLMTAESYKFTGDLQRANAAAKDAFNVYQTLEDSYQAQEMDNLLEGLDGTDLYDEADSYKHAFNKKVCAETDWGKLNMSGMSHYRKGHFAEAFECFEESIEVVSNPSILLNLVQAGHELIRKEPERADDVLSVCNRYLLDVNIGALNSKQQKRYRTLSERRAQLLDSLGND